MADYKPEQEYKTEMLECAPRVLPADGELALSLVHPDVIAKNYCCGLRFPHLLNGLRVLSLGCGSVRDCFVLSKLIGSKGEVVGVDPNDHVVTFGQRFLDYHREAVGFSENNIKFIKGDPHDLIPSAGLQKDYFDLICFNTVVGLTPKKQEIMRQLQQLLKTGGEVFFTEMVASSRVRDEVKEDQSLWVEGLAGAFYWEDLVSTSRDFGFSTPRLVQATDMRIKEPELDRFIGGIQYSMATYRMFKLPSKQSKKEEVMIYNNPSENDDSMNIITFDASNKFKNGKPVRVDPEMVTVIKNSRYSSVFTTSTDSTQKTLKHCQVNPFEAL